ncbi:MULTISPECIES: DUF6737 family protein [Prochlorococcus]|uniref:Uncharacterized membrane protein n=1 Tax=Prochlorococcus marinus (strain SARG / CCMP1375 / SS120) TaxID=167539 RepID=Q7VC66_PROMA|nr:MULTISPECIES: DUF6737 family protein [Prochlorococcus]AAP99920.1 Uncharacterized membrane protein [Prochlorococcus marinus subsp. marinus str. CCMP1375]KGG18854.1 putative membrane protein [Prochlorococcus marinus str. SS2]KGG23608.1 putative membrane protein [Prochlorococcus marinus str. SS35]KGG11732.1 putative membrane protein [Prochlorococcus marinus str. LG]KGG32156.1 putative membrane protein [Prochlorococcus marinus str. SS51]
MNLHLSSFTKNHYWDSKPKWCQPWSIIITGVLSIIIIFVTFKNFWLTIIASFLITLWWILFLFIAPMIYNIELVQSEKDEE